MDIKEHIIGLAKKIKGKVILPESLDPRILKAAQMLTRDGVCSVVLPAHDAAAVEKAASGAGVNLDGVEIVKIDRAVLDDKKIEEFVAARTKKGMSPEDALELLNKPTYFSMMYLKSGKCDACVCGAATDTAEVLRSAIHVVGAAAGIKMASSYFLMVPPQGHKLIKDPVIFADCSVNPSPDGAGLKDIAVAAVSNFQKLFAGRHANVAFLSFSTKGSGSNKTGVITPVLDAVSAAKKHFEGNATVNVDGEMQFDAAIIPEIAKRKAPGSSVAGKANIFIFPDLNSGNICYKVAERLGGFQAIGPVIQGMALPISDLSRGCSEHDVYFTSALMIAVK